MILLTFRGGVVLRVVGPLVPLYLLIRSELIECIIKLSYETTLCRCLLCPLTGMAWLSEWQVLVRQCSKTFLEWVTLSPRTQFPKLSVSLSTLCRMSPGESRQLPV